MIAASDLQISVKDTPDGWHWRIVGCVVGSNRPHRPEVLATSMIRNGASSDVLAFAEAARLVTEFSGGDAPVSVPMAVLAQLAALYGDLLDELAELRPGTPIPGLVLGGMSDEEQAEFTDHLLREGSGY